MSPDRSLPVADGTVYVFPLLSVMLVMSTVGPPIHAATIKFPVVGNCTLKGLPVVEVISP
jgi:hypothetical protein